MWKNCLCDVTLDAVLIFAFVCLHVNLVIEFERDILFYSNTEPWKLVRSGVCPTGDRLGDVCVINSARRRLGVMWGGCVSPRQ